MHAAVRQDEERRCDGWVGAVSCSSLQTSRACSMPSMGEMDPHSRTTASTCTSLCWRPRDGCMVLLCWITPCWITQRQVLVRL